MQVALIHKPMDVTLSTHFELDRKMILLNKEKSEDQNYGAVSLGVGGEHCKGMPLDSCVPTKYKIDFIKLDVETCEMFVLNGGQRILRDWKPALLIEYHSSDTIFKPQYDGVINILGNPETDTNLFTYLLKTQGYTGMVKITDNYWYAWHNPDHRI